MGELDGKVAVVTGSTRGIGRAVLVSLAEEGALVVVQGRNPAECAAVAAATPGAFGRACDIGAPGEPTISSTQPSTPSAGSPRFGGRQKVG